MSHASKERAWAEIDLSALRHNLAYARQRSGQDIMGVIKADAYGHGLTQVARVLDQENLPYLGVAHSGEARRLGEAGIRTPIYLLGATVPDEREEIVARGWTPCLCSFDEITHFDSLATSPLSTHLAIDTGMGRGGFLPDQLPDVVEKLKNTSHLTITGIGSHLPVADEDREFTESQFRRFDQIVTDLRPHFVKKDAPFHIHLANSAGLLDYRSTTTNLCRPGLMLYGASPLAEFADELRPVMTLKTHISLINTLPAGHGVSYGRTVLEKDTRTAVLGIGYGDGYPRSLSEKNTHILIHDTPCPLLGRVTMDQIIVDVSHLPDCKEGDEAILFGSGGQGLSVSDIAEKAGTIPWEILTQITPRVNRHYLDHS